MSDWQPCLNMHILSWVFMCLQIIKIAQPFTHKFVTQRILQSTDRLPQLPILTQKSHTLIFSWMFMFMQKNRNEPVTDSGDIADQRILKSDWLTPIFDNTHTKQEP